MYELPFSDLPRIIRRAPRGSHRSKNFPTMSALPYDGDMQAAMRAQDRSAIRELMAARDSNTAPKSDAGQIDMTCPICKELLFKPTVNACGHTFCFWCVHFSMDALSPSSCPLCRAPFDHLPRPSETLHLFVQSMAPEESFRRAEEMRAQEESEFHASSPEMPAVGEVDWSCAMCAQIVRHPLVQVCGHLCCAHCLPNGEGASPKPSCAACGARQVYRPKVCLLAVAALGGEADATLDNAESASSLEAVDDDDDDGNSSRAGGADVAGGVNGGGSSEPLRVPAYIHFGVGCDGCGKYPITGRAFRCCECPEAIGYDLCEGCHDVPPGTGRFGQAHRPKHQMEERAQAQTWLHHLQAARPEMELRELLAIAQIGFAEEPTDAGEGEPLPPPDAFEFTDGPPRNPSPDAGPDSSA